MNILLTGGAGYIGSHAAVALAKAKHRIIIYDNFCNSSFDVISRLCKVTGQTILTVRGDIRDTPLLQASIEKYNIAAVLHFAGLKAVSESVMRPVEYYSNNIQGSISLLQAMQNANQGRGIKKLIFSSSATVYGEPRYLPIDEDHPIHATSPYGRSKLHIEEMFTDVAHSDSSWQIVSLRYFNPVGAHESGLIGEEPNGIPNNLMPYILHVADGQLPYLNVFGNDYPTVDGTGIRDFIHVMDLAEGHLAALHYLSEGSSGFFTFNLGTGIGFSVLELIHSFEMNTNYCIPYKIVSRRPGDIASSYAKVDKARQLLGWEAKRSIADMMMSAWGWQSRRLAFLEKS